VATLPCRVNERAKIGIESCLVKLLVTNHPISSERLTLIASFPKAYRRD
jgi:hypothetical protein